MSPTMLTALGGLVVGVLSIVLSYLRSRREDESKDVAEVLLERREMTKDLRVELERKDAIIRQLQEDNDACLRRNRGLIDDNQRLEDEKHQLRDDLMVLTKVVLGKVAEEVEKFDGAVDDLLGDEGV